MSPTKHSRLHQGLTTLQAENLRIGGHTKVDTLLASDVNSKLPRFEYNNHYFSPSAIYCLISPRPTLRPTIKPLLLDLTPLGYGLCNRKRNEIREVGKFFVNIKLL